MFNDKENMHRYSSLLDKIDAENGSEAPPETGPENESPTKLPLQETAPQLPQHPPNTKAPDSKRARKFEFQNEIQTMQKNMQKGEVYNEEEIIFKIQQKVHKAMLDKKMDLLSVADLNELVFEQAARHIVENKYVKEIESRQKHTQNDKNSASNTHPKSSLKHKP